jgi:hypothetical protein
MLQLDTENADRNLTSLITVLTHTPSALLPFRCQALVKLGDGAKNLDGTGGDFQVVVTVGGQTVQPSPQTVTFSTAVRAAIFTSEFPVPAGEEVVVRVLSPNAGDTDVDVTAYLYDVIGSAQASLDAALAILDHADYGNAKLVRSTTPANTLSVDANHLVGTPATQKVDVETIKTRAVTCAAAVTVQPTVGLAAAKATQLEAAIGTGVVFADVTQISTSAPAADNLEAVLLGTGAAGDVDISIRKLTINNDAGVAIDIDSSSIGIDVDSTGPALTLDSASSYAMHVHSSGSATAGLEIIGGGTGHGLKVTGGDEGDGIYAIGGATGGSGLRVSGTGTGGSGIIAMGVGTGSGIYALASSTGHGALLQGGVTSGHGLYAWAATAGDGIHAESGGLGSGMELVGATGYADLAGDLNVTQITGSALAANHLAAANLAHQDDNTIVLDLTGCDTDLERGTALDAAITAVQALTPGGAAISASNRARLLIPTGRYDVAALEPDMTVEGIDLEAIEPKWGGRRKATDHDYDDGTTSLSEFRPNNVVIYTTTAAKHALIQTAADVRMTGITAAHLGASPGVGHGLYVKATNNAPSVYDLCYFWGRAGNPMAFARDVDGIWTRCISCARGWRIPLASSTLKNDPDDAAQFKARMYDVEFGAYSICGDYDFDHPGTHKMSGAHLERFKGIGLWLNYEDSGTACIAGCGSWACPIDSTCVFIDGEVGPYSFAIGAKDEGTCIRCRGGIRCRGSYGAAWAGEDNIGFAGVDIDGVWGANSLGGTYATGAHGHCWGFVKNSVVRDCTYPIRLSGATLENVTITQAGTDKDCVTLLDSTSKINHSTLIGNGTGKAVNAASALSFTGVGNSYIGGLGANVSASGVGDEVTPTTASKTGYALSEAGVTAVQSGLATPTNITAASGVALSATGADLIAKTSTFALAMADAVLDEATSGHTTAGTLGKAVADILEDTGTGSGARTVTIAVNDGTDALEAAKVRLTMGALTYSGNTNTSGQVTFNLDDGTWTVAISLAGYTYSGTTVVVNGDETATYSMTATSITPPSDATLTTIQFRVKLSNTAVAGAVCKAKLLGVNQCSDGTILSNEESSDTTDADGIAELELVQKGSIVKGSGLYKIWVEIAGRPVASVETKIPSQSTILFEDLLA